MDTWKEECMLREVAWGLLSHCMDDPGGEGGRSGCVCPSVVFWTIVSGQHSGGPENSSDNEKISIEGNDGIGAG